MNGTAAMRCLALLSLFPVACGGGSSSGGGAPLDPAIGRARPAESLLDPTFGVDGVAVDSVENQAIVEGGRMTRDGSGRLVLVGTAGNQRLSSKVFVSRVLEDGRLDVGFGQAGVVVLNEPALSESVPLLVDSQGRIATAERTTDGLALWRLLEDGTGDPGFGTSGRVDLPLAATPHALVERAGGGVLLAGNAGDADSLDRFAFVAAFDDAGELDLAFGADGFFCPDDGGELRDVLWDGPGRLLVVGIHGDQLGLWAVTARGDPDLSFGSNGGLLRPLAGITGFDRTEGWDIARSAEGAVTVLGRAFRTQYESEVVVLRLVEGALDPGFGGHGWVSFPNEGAGRLHPWSLAVDSGGRVLVGGYYRYSQPVPGGGVVRFFGLLLRFEASGDLLGKNVRFFDRNSTTMGIVVDEEGRVSVNGATHYAGRSEFRRRTIWRLSWP